MIFLNKMSKTHFHIQKFPNGTTQITFALSNPTTQINILPELETRPKHCLNVPCSDLSHIHYGYVFYSQMLV